jgi:hypothetical protein
MFSTIERMAPLSLARIDDQHFDFFEACGDGLRTRRWPAVDDVSRCRHRFPVQRPAAGRCRRP